MEGSRTSVTGLVRNFNYGPGGLDGLILDSGTIIHFPQEYGSQVTSLAPIGSAVTASGWSHIGPAGDTLFDADAITNQRNWASLAVTGGPLGAPAPPLPLGPPGPGAVPPPPPPPPGPAAYGPIPPVPPPPAGPDYRSGTQPVVGVSVITGVVRSYNYGLDGQVNGLILSDGTAVYSAPELGAQVAQLAPVGTRVRITGQPRIGRAGNRLIDAAIITNQRTGASVTAVNAAVPLPPRIP